MVGLPATGELSYNGYLFDGATHIEAGVEFLYDDAGRTIIAHRHTITVDAIVAEDKELDSEVLNIRQRLGEPGKKLTFISKGFGDDLRAVGVVSDVAAGPHPKELSWVSLGDDKAAKIRWQVVVTVPLCVLGVPAFVGVMALNYSIAYVIDAMTDTTRTIEGYIEIAQKAGAQASDTADRFRNQFSPDPITGFRREQSWTGNLSKNRVDFVIVDTQIPSPNPYPTNVIAITGSHRLSWRRRPNGAWFRNAISMSITPEAGLSGSQAWQVFLTIAAQRISKAKANGQPVLIEAIEVEENLFGRPQSFSVSYRMLSCISDFVGDAGLWEPLGTDWNSWKVSLRGTMFHNRGNARLEDIAANDVVVDLCKSPGIAFVSPNNASRVFVDNRIHSGGLQNEKPPADKSWAAYRSTIVPYRDKPAIRQAIIQAPVKDDGQWDLYAGEVPPTGGFLFGSAGGVTADVIQEGGAGRHGVRIFGRAERVGYEIPRPALVTIGDRTAVERWFRGMQWVVGNYFGVPVYAAMWAADYMTDASPGTIKPPREEQQWVDPKAGIVAEPSPGMIP